MLHYLFSFLIQNLRRDGDSNPGYPLGVYTLSRRASSTTRASLLIYNFLKSAANYKKFANHQHFQLQMYSFFCSRIAFSAYNL